MPLHFITSQRGAPLLVHKGYVYSRDKCGGEKSTWRCVELKNFGCKSRCHSTHEEVLSAAEHNHPPQPDSLHSRIVRQTIKQKARTSAETPEEIIGDDVMAALHEHGPGATRCVQSIKRMISRARKPPVLKMKKEVPPQPQANINVMDIYKKYNINTHEINSMLCNQDDLDNSMNSNTEEMTDTSICNVQIDLPESKPSIQKNPKVKKTEAKVDSTPTASKKYSVQTNADRKRTTDKYCYFGHYIALTLNKLSPEKASKIEMEIMRIFVRELEIDPKDSDVGYDVGQSQEHDQNAADHHDKIMLLLEQIGSKHFYQNVEETDNGKNQLLNYESDDSSNNQDALHKNMDPDDIPLSAYPYIENTFSCNKTNFPEIVEQSYNSRGDPLAITIKKEYKRSSKFNEKVIAKRHKANNDYTENDTPSESSNDPLDIFFRSVIATVRTFPARLIPEVKLKMYNLIGEFEMKTVNDNFASNFVSLPS